MRILSILSESFSYAGLSGKLLQVEPDSLPVASPDFYIRKALNEKHAKALAEELQKGEELPPVVVAYIRELSGYRIINGNHTTKAHQIVGKPVKVLDLGELDFESAVKLQAELNHIGQVLALTTEDLKHYAVVLYSSFRSELLGKKDRATALQKIALLLRKSERQIYRYLQEVLEEEDKQLKQKAYELYEKGYTQEQIAQELGVAQQTVSLWLDNNSQLKKDIIRKAVKILIFDMMSKIGNLSPSHSTFMTLNLNKDFVELLESYYSLQDVKFRDFPEWVRSKGYELDQEEWEKFFSFVVKTLERGMLMNIKKDEKFIQKYLEEELKPLGKKAREGIVSGYLSVALEKSRKDVEKIKKIVLEVCEDLDVVDIRAEVKRRAKDIYYTKYLDLLLSQFEEEIEECMKKYPVLEWSELEERLEKYLELDSKEEMLEELKADYPDRRIPAEVVDRLWEEKRERAYNALKERLSKIESLSALERELEKLSSFEKELYESSKELKAIEKALREKEEKEFIQSLKDGIKALQWGSLDELMQGLEEKERAIALRYVSELKKAFAELPVPEDKEVIELIEKGLADEEILDYFKGRGLYLEKARLLKLREEWLRRKEEERRRAEEELRRREEELKKKEEEIKQKEAGVGRGAIDIIPQEVVEGKLLSEEEDLPDWVVEEYLSDVVDEKEIRGLGLKGVLRELEGLKKQLLEIQEELPEDRTKKKLEKAIEKLQKIIQRVEVSIEKKESKKADPQAVKYAYRALKEFTDFYKQHTGSELAPADKKRGMKELVKFFDDALKEGIDLKQYYEDLKDAMDYQFSLLRMGKVKDLAFVTISDLVKNFSRYLAAARQSVAQEYAHKRAEEYLRSILTRNKEVENYLRGVIDG